MISRQDTVSAIGYDGNAALIDRSAKKRYGSMTTEQLAKAGFYRAAAASAILSGSDDELALVATVYNEASGANYSPEAIPRLFGVAKVSVAKTLSL